MEHREDYRPDGSDGEQYYESYEDLAVHRVMLADRPRMDFYRRILFKPSVVAGKVVVDVGSGSGVLSIWAAQAGAAHVISIEASSLSSLQPLLFEENAVASTVTAVHSTVEQLIERGVEDFLEAHPHVRATGVSVVISEWMGFYLFHEGMLGSVLAARDFFNEVNRSLGVEHTVEMVPSSARLLAAPISLCPLYKSAYETFWGNVDGVRMNTLGQLSFDLFVNGSSPLVQVIPPECLLDEGAVLWERDLRTLKSEELAEIEAAAQYSLTRTPGSRGTCAAGDDTPVDGFTLWFDVAFEEEVLSSSPEAVPTHWKQTTVLLPPDAREAKLLTVGKLDGQPLSVTFTLVMSSSCSRYYTIGFELA